MDQILYNIHETLSLLTMLIGFSLTVRSLYSFFSDAHYNLLDKALAIFFIVFIYVQLALQLVIFSIKTYSYEESFAALEHLSLVIVAVVFVQIGRLISIKSKDSIVKFRFRVIFYGLATALLIYSYFL